MTEKLYEQDSLLCNCIARVTNCTTDKDEFLIELDKTVLFPEGGGQLSDRGKLNEFPVTHVSEKDGHIYHHCPTSLNVDEKVNVTLDWDIRLDRMQQHCGEHLLSYACWKLCQALNVGFHMNEERVFIDLDKDISDEDLTKAQMLTNEIIWDNRPVTVQYLPLEEAVKLKDKMRKFNDKLTGILRLVSVQDADICTCCGTHPPFTGMVGMVKILGKVKHKEGCRIEFVCGKRALQYLDTNLKILYQISDSLSTSPDLVMENLRKQKEEKMELQSRLGNANRELLRHKLEQICAKDLQYFQGNNLIILTCDGLDGREEKYLQELLQIKKNLVLLCINNYNGRTKYSLLRTADAAVDCGKILRELNPVFNGKGGGKNDFAQGSTELIKDPSVLIPAVLEKMNSL